MVALLLFVVVVGSEGNESDDQDHKNDDSDDQGSAHTGRFASNHDSLVISSGGGSDTFIGIGDLGNSDNHEVRGVIAIVGFGCSAKLDGGLY